MTAPTDFDNCGQYDNTATVSADNAGEPVDDDGLITCQKPDLTVDKTPDAQNINAGEDVVFDITVTNNGPGTAKGVKLSDPLPGPIAGTWAVSGADAADCVDPIVGDTLDCTFGDLTPPRAARGRSRSPQAPSSVPAPPTTTPRPRRRPTRRTQPTTARSPARSPTSSVDKTPDAQTINAGEDVVFDITVTNNGPGTAKAVKLDDPLPGPIAGTWAVSGADAADCVSPIVGDTLDCSFGDLRLR